MTRVARRNSQSFAYQSCRASHNISLSVLHPGIESLACFDYADADEVTSSLTNVSTWKTLDNAKQTDTFQPMRDLGKVFAQRGPIFARLNYLTQW